LNEAGAAQWRLVLTFEMVIDAFLAKDKTLAGIGHWRGETKIVVGSRDMPIPPRPETML
jgi:hypothetical protein